MLPPSPTCQQLDRLLTGELQLAEFESWIYSTPEVGLEVGASAYFDLLEFDYRQPHADLALAKLVAAVYEGTRPGLLLRDRAYRWARGLLSEEIPLPQAVHALANLWYDGYEWVWAEFVGISSEFDDDPDPSQYSDWEPNALAKYLQGWREKESQLEASARHAAREFLKHEFPYWPTERGAAVDVAPR